MNQVMNQASNSLQDLFRGMLCGETTQGRRKSSQRRSMQSLQSTIQRSPSMKICGAVRLDLKRLYVLKNAMIRRRPIHLANVSMTHSSHIANAFPRRLIASHLDHEGNANDSHGNPALTTTALVKLITRMTFPMTSYPCRSL